MSFLTVLPPDTPGFRYDIESPTVEIGRASSNNLVLHDTSASRTHARILKRPDGYYIVDLKSKNLTCINDREVTAPTRLNPGDRIRIGKTHLVFDDVASAGVEISDEPLGPETQTTVLPVEELLTEVTPPGAGLPASGIAGILLEADEDLVYHRPLQEIFVRIMDLAKRAVPYERGALMRLKDGSLVKELVWPPASEHGGALRVSRTITEHVLEKHEAVLVLDAIEDPRFRSGWSVREDQIRSVMCVPLWNNRAVTGCIYVDSRRRPGLFTEENLRVLTSLANVGAIKIENAELFRKTVDYETEIRKREEDIQAAAEIQRCLLPAAAPSIPGYAVDGATFPSREVGGDLFDYLSLQDRCYGIGLGDVAGKGLPAALLMSNFLANLRALIALHTPIASMMGLLNNLLCGRIPENRYVTFFYCVLDPEKHTLTYVNAGHPAALLLRARGQVEPLAMNSMVVGMVPDIPFRTETVSLDPGDLLVCCSDGVVEAHDPDEQDWGQDGLAAFVAKHRDRPPKEVLDLVVSAVDERCGGREHRDDVTLVLLRRER